MKEHNKVSSDVSAIKMKEHSEEFKGVPGKTKKDSCNKKLRIFEIYDTTKRGHKACAVLFAYKNELSIEDDFEDEYSYEIEIAPCAKDDRLPLILEHFAEKGIYKLDAYWSHKWVQERVVPSSRQNLGEILRAHNLEHYDELELFASGKGRTSQDDFMVREIESSVLEEAFRDDVELESLNREELFGIDYFAVQDIDKDGTAAKSKGLTIQEDFGALISQKRKECGLTQRDLSEKTGIDQGLISRIETGKANPSLQMMSDIAAGFNMELGLSLKR